MAREDYIVLVGPFAYGPFRNVKRAQDWLAETFDSGRSVAIVMLRPPSELQPPEAHA